MSDSAALRLTLLGAPQVVRGAGSAVILRSRKQLALLAYLAVEQHHPSSRDTLISLLWPDADEHAARNNLRVALADLRRLLGEADPAFLQTTRHTVQFDRSSDHALDVEACRALHAACRSHAHEALETCAACLARLEQAVALYRGDFLHGFALPDSAPFEEWALLQREQLHQAALDALETLANAAERRGDYAAQCRHARRQIELEPWREAAHLQAMRGLWASGQRGAALEQYAACAKILGEELGIEPDAATTALYEAIKQGNGHVPGARKPALHPADAHAPPLPATEAANNLPVPLTACIGRDAELAELVALGQSPDVRLITLVGMGGIGKTHLSLELGRARLHEFADGVCFVPLAPLGAPSAIAPAILTTLGIQITSGDPHQTLVQALRARRLLLILDNFEHLLDGASIVADVLQSAPQVEIVVTSRERLNLRGEYPYLLQGLAYAQHATLAEASDAAAVRVFVHHAKRVHRAFKLRDDNLQAVLRICDLVEGMPLGLELAAAWTESLSPGEIAREIERSADFLAFDWRDIPDRQRSMRAVFEWSWQLLNDAERRVLRGLSVFRGGCTREAAHAVAEAPLRVLTSLTHKSLLRYHQAHAGAGRYELHELLRQFAAGSLDAAQERAAVEQRHSQFFLAFVAQRGVRLARNQPLEAAAEIQAEIDNVRAAWAWAVAHAHVGALGDAAYTLWQYFFFMGLVMEGEAVFRTAAERIGGQAAQAMLAHDQSQRVQRVLSKLLGIWGVFLMPQGKHDQALAIADQAIELGQASAGIEGEALGYLVKGQALRRQGYSVESRALLERAAELARRGADTDASREPLAEIERRSYNWLCSIALTLDEYSAAKRYAEQGLQLSRSLGKLIGELISLTDLTDIAKATGDYRAARRSAEQGLDLARLLRFSWGEAQTQLLLGTIAFFQGQCSRANQYFERSLAMFREIQQPLNEAYAVANLGQLHLFMGAYAQAEEWLDRYFEIIRGMNLPARELFLGLLPLALLARARGNANQALVYAEQAWQMAQELDGTSSQAHALLILGRIYGTLGRLADATDAYKRAREMYDALGLPHLAVEASAGLAATLVAEGDLARALRHVEAIMPVLASHQYVGVDAPFAIYLTCYRVLHAHNDARAVSIVQTAQRRLHEYAEHIADPALRHSFFHNVATHRELIQVATNLVVDDAHGTAAFTRTHGAG